MKNEVCKKVEGYAVYNRCMPTSIDRFFSGGTEENNKKWCEEYIQENHRFTDIRAIKATLYYEIPEDKTFCNKSEKCSDSVCYCGELGKE